MDHYIVENGKKRKVSEEEFKKEQELMMIEEDKRIVMKCTCGKEFKTWANIYRESPYDYMCPDCLKKESWNFATRMLNLEKFRCVKCGWKLKEKDCTAIEELEIWFKCKCCGYRFALMVPEPSYDGYDDGYDDY